MGSDRVGGDGGGSRSDAVVGAGARDSRARQPAHLWVEGVGSTVRFYADEEVSYEHTWNGETAGPPKHYDFALNICTMDGEFLPDLGVWCTGVRRLDDAGEDAGPTYHTQAEWNATTYVQSTGIYSWETDDPDLISPVRFYIDAASGRAHGLEAMSAS